MVPFGQQQVQALETSKIEKLRHKIFENRRRRADDHHRNLEDSSPDPAAFLDALVAGIPSLIVVAVNGLTDVLTTLVTDPANLFNAIFEAVFNLVAAAVVIVVNVGAALLPPVINGIIQTVLAGFDPMTLTTEGGDGDYLHNDGQCTWSYDIDSLELIGLSSGSLNGLVLNDVVLESSTISASLEASLGYSSLDWKFMGNLYTNSTDCQNTTYTTTATMTNPFIDIKVDFAGDLVFNSTTNTDVISFTEVNFEELTMGNFDSYVFDGDYDFLNIKLAEEIDSFVETAETATSDPNNFLNSTGITLPYSFDTGTDIPLLP